MTKTEPSCQDIRRSRSKNIWPLLIFFLVISSIILWACDTAGDNQSKKAGSENAEPNAIGIILDSIRPIPDTIYGCGDYYAYDSIDLASEKYIFLSRMSEVALISINKSIIYLNIDTSASESTGDYINDVYTGNNIKVTLSVRKQSQYDEGSFYKGELIIQRGEKKEVFKVYGISGC